MHCNQFVNFWFRFFCFFSPKCRTEYPHNEFPTVYKCFCGKTRDPEDDPWQLPHSCGETCQRPLRPQCGHLCLLLCHPGKSFHCLFGCHVGTLDIRVGNVWTFINIMVPVFYFITNFMPGDLFCCLQSFFI